MKEEDIEEGFDLLEECFIKSNPVYVFLKINRG